jgi:hypothetical protein
MKSKGSTFGLPWYQKGEGLFTNVDQTINVYDTTTTKELRPRFPFLSDAFVKDDEYAGFCGKSLGSGVATTAVRR